MATPSLGRARGRRCCHGRPAWSVLLIRLLVLLLALLLWTPAAEGRWAGKDEAPKKTCRNARLQVSAPASAAGPLSVNPGEAFPIVLRVPRRACRQDKGMNCTIVARLADGLFLAGPKAVAKAAVSTDLPDFSRTITWSLATLQAAATATATAAEPPQQAKKRPRAKYQEYTFKLAADACAAPLNLAMSLQLVRSKASRRRGQKTVCRTPAVAVKVRGLWDKGTVCERAGAGPCLCPPAPFPGRWIHSVRSWTVSPNSLSPSSRSSSRGACRVPSTTASRGAALSPAASCAATTAVSAKSA